MKNPSISTLKKYVSALTRSKKKYVTVEYLSHLVGVYPEVIVENLEYFEPMLAMDTEYNLIDLLPQIDDYIATKGDKRGPIIDQSIVVRKKTLGEYESINDFIYRKMSIGGIIDRSAELSDKDLRILKKLIAEEQAKRKTSK